MKQRLAPYGLGDDAYKGRLCPDKLFERQQKRCIGTARQSDSTYIDLDPCPVEALPPMPTLQRVELVTVVYTDGSHAPVTYGIPIDWYATNQQLSDGVRKQCHVPEDKQIVLVLLEKNRLSRYPAYYHIFCMCM